MLRSRILGLVAALSLGGSLLAAAPVMAGNARPFQFDVTFWDFTGFACRAVPEDHCVADATAAGVFTDNLSSRSGTVTFDWVVDFYDGFDAPCNHVSEVATFALDDGTITMTSGHTDCLQHGNRIETSLQLVGGTGAYAGATGSGRERAGLSGKHSDLTYFGMISVGS